MKCILCGRTPIETKIDSFPLKPEARGMLSRQSGIDADDFMASHGICRVCRALPVGERGRLAALAIEEEREEYRRELNEEYRRELNEEYRRELNDEYRRELIEEALNKFRN